MRECLAVHVRNPYDRIRSFFVRSHLNSNCCRMEAQRESPEFELLLCSARTEIDAPVAQRMQHLLEENLDWQALLSLASYHRVLPLLYRSLKTTSLEAQVPSDVAAYLRRALHMTAGFNLSLLKELGRVLALFDAAGISVIAFKGPVLAQSVYGSLGLRPSWDLDLFIPEERYDEVEALLVQAGYRPSQKVQDLSRFGKAAYLQISRQCPFGRAGKYALDVHTGLMPPGYLLPTSFAAYLERSETLEIAGVQMQSFAPEDLLQILCYHGVKNRWEALKHVCDIAELVRAYPELDWGEVRARARAARGERILDLGLCLAHELLGAPVPPGVLEEATAEVRDLARQVEGRLPRQVELGLAEYPERFWFHLKVQETWSTKARYCLYALARKVHGSLFQVQMET